MSMSIGGSAQALSQAQSPWQSQAGKPAGSDPLTDLLQSFGSSGAPLPTPNLPSSGTSASGAVGSFDPGTFTALLSTQEQAASGGPTQAGGAQDPSGAQTDDSNDQSTTTSVTNADGSVTTTVTDGNGTETVTTTPPVQQIGAATSSDPASSNPLSDNLSQLESLLAPVAATALTALLL